MEAEIRGCFTSLSFLHLEDAIDKSAKDSAWFSQVDSLRIVRQSWQAKPDSKEFEFAFVYVLSGDINSPCRFNMNVRQFHTHTHTLTNLTTVDVESSPCVYFKNVPENQTVLSWALVEQVQVAKEDWPTRKGLGFFPISTLVNLHHWFLFTFTLNYVCFVVSKHSFWDIQFACFNIVSNIHRRISPSEV